MANWGEETKRCDDDESEIERLERQIKCYEESIAKKKAYLEFLKANPQFVEYQKLKNEAN